MDEHCHRCGSALPPNEGGATFCSHCGAPQLYLSEYATVTSSGESTADSTGALPPPRPQQIDWKTAIQCAAVVALVSAALSLGAIRLELLSPVSSFWILGASMIALSLYQRRHPLAWMDAAVGARIGLLVGIAQVATLLAAMVVAGLVARFALHSMNGFDVELTKQLQVQIQKVTATNPAAAGMLHFFYAPEFRAGIVLTWTAMLGAIVMVLSTVSGALGGLLRTRRGVSA